MPDAYKELAPIYDAMAADPALKVMYAEWRASLRAAVRARGLRPRVLVDLACGTGNTTIPWSRRRGLVVVGVDKSAAMLGVARRKRSRVRWYRQDLLSLRVEELADLVTCHFDALNHLLSDAHLQRALRNAARIMRPGGLFQFDLNTRYWLEWLSTSEKLFRVGPNVFTAYNEFDRATGIATFRQMWFVRRGSFYKRFDVTVRQRAWSDAAIRRMLRRAGLRLLSATTQRAFGKDPIRKLYLAVREPA